MITPAEFLEGADYSEKDFESVSDAQHILNLLNCDTCRNILDKNDFYKCAKDVLNSDDCRAKLRGNTWPAVQKVNALEVSQRIFNKRSQRLEAAEERARFTEEKEEPPTPTLKVGQRVILKELKSEHMNGRSAHIIRLDGEHAIVITSPNDGFPIKVKRANCDGNVPWQNFQFKPTDKFQAFPIGAQAPSGLSFDMDLGNRGYNLYKRLDSERRR